MKRCSAVTAAVSSACIGSAGSRTTPCQMPTSPLATYWSRLKGRKSSSVGGALASIALVAAFGLALSWIFAFVALTVRGAEAAQTAGFVVIFPLVFASSIFVPLTTLPGWLEAIAKVSPVTLTANAARSLALTGSPDSLAGAAAWICGLLAVFVPVCVWRYRRMS